MNLFKTKLPFWGGNIVDSNNNDLGFKIINTCAFDNFLLALWVSTKLNITIFNYISRKHLIDSFKSIEQNEWNKAESIWLQEFIYAYVCDFECSCSECKISVKD